MNGVFTQSVDDNKLVIVRSKRSDVAADAEVIVEIKDTWTAFSCALDTPQTAADRSLFLANAK